MRHRRTTNRLPQKPGHARMMTRNLVTSMLLYEKLRTTKKRADVIAPEIDRLIRYAKTHQPYLAIRRLNEFVTDKNASRKVMEVLMKRYVARDSGLTRVTPVGSRKGDGAMLVDLAFVEGAEVALEAKPEKAKKSAKVTKTKKATASKK